MVHKSFKDLNLSNAFLFAAALEDKDTCEIVLQCILGEKIHLEDVRAENSILFSSDFHSLRLDIYASSHAKVSYNLEMQNEDRHNLPKRSRFHQAEMDITSLKPGEDYSMLAPSYVVFICDFDPFNRELYRYTFEEQCVEAAFPLEDEAKRIFLSTKGNNDADVPVELIHFLRYVMDSTDEYARQSEDLSIQELHNKVKTLKASRDLEAKYMLFEELLQDSKADGRAEGRAEGKAEGQQRMLSLIEAMIADGKTEEISRLKTDEEFFDSMMAMYHVE